MSFPLERFKKKWVKQSEEYDFNENVPSFWPFYRKISIVGLSLVPSVLWFYITKDA